MNLNHIDLPVADLPGATAFFRDLMGFQCVFARADGLTVLLDEDQLALTLSPVPPGEALRYPTGFHIGFNLDHEHELYETHGRIAAAGLSIIRPLGDLGGALTFQCEAPGPLVIEFAWRPRS
jgi:catechol 2,3-dioxygenase-like lactoylglutathione lyase family enzyme